MTNGKSVLLVRLAFAVSILLALPGCNRNSSHDLNVEKPLAVATPAPSSSAPAATAAVAKLPPPTKAQVKEAFHRAFGDDLIAEPNDGSGHPAFIVGDFNGDQSEDLAVIARPAAGKLSDVNSEVANWIIQDARKAFIAPQGKTVVIPPGQERPRIESGEQVLAIIHGVGPTGWRNPDARQAFIVKHGVAIFQGTAPSLSQKAVRAMHLPFETEIIKGVRNNQKGFLFWTGGAYAWHPQ